MKTSQKLDALSNSKPTDVRPVALPQCHGAAPGFSIILLQDDFVLT